MADTEHLGTPIRFRLRSVFGLLAIVAVLSEVARWGRGADDSPILLGVAYFGYGGMVSLIVYVGTSVMVLIGMRSPHAQRGGIILSTILAALVWISVLIATTYRWIPICGLFSLLAIACVAFLARSELTEERGVSPRGTLRRLRRVKDRTEAQLNRHATPRVR